MITVAELPEYIRCAEKLLSDPERRSVVDYLAEHPRAGDVMEATRGIRKLRWGRGGRGKSGGVRVIYYFYNDEMPLYLITLFAKNEQENLTKAERNNLGELVEVLVAGWRVGVGIMVTHNPLHRSGLAEFPHPALASSNDAKAA
jgi:hypothetical protein